MAGHSTLEFLAEGWLSELIVRGGRVTMKRLRVTRFSAKGTYELTFFFPIAVLLCGKVDICFAFPCGCQ